MRKMTYQNNLMFSNQKYIHSTWGSQEHWYDILNDIFWIIEKILEDDFDGYFIIRNNRKFHLGLYVRLYCEFLGKITCFESQRWFMKIALTFYLRHARRFWYGILLKMTFWIMKEILKNDLDGTFIIRNNRRLHL